MCYMFWNMFRRCSEDGWQTVGIGLGDFRKMFGRVLGDVWADVWEMVGGFLADL